MLKRTLLAMLVLTVALPAMAQVSAVTDISVKVPSIIVLYYRPAVEFDVTSSLPAVLGLSSAETTALEPGLVSLTGLTGDALVDGTPAGFSDPGTLVATVSNFWAVRSLGPNNTRVTVSFVEPDITLGASTISMTGLETGIGGSFGGASVDFAPQGLSFGNVVQGDVRFDVDMDSMTASGNHTGGQIRVTAENL